MIVEILVVVLLVGFCAMLVSNGWNRQRTMAAEREYFERENRKAREDAEGASAG